MRPGVKGTFTSTSGVLRRLLDCRTAAENDQVGERDLLAAGRRGVELLLDRFELLQHLRQFRRLVDLPVLLRREANARAVAPPRLSEPRKVDADAQAVETSCGDRQARRRGSSP